MWLKCSVEIFKSFTANWNGQMESGINDSFGRVSGYPGIRVSGYPGIRVPGYAAQPY